MNDLYAPFVRQGNPVIFMDIRSAELTKYAANAYLAMRISFMNEIANLCEKVGADVNNVRRGIGTDNRIGKRFLFAGIGYGGSCFPKDVQALFKTSQEYAYDFKILKSVMAANTLQKNVMVEKIKKYYGDKLKGKTIAVWGLAFKPNTDDIREAPALHIIEELLKEGVNIKAYDPEAMENVKKLMGDKIELVAEPYDALVEADSLAIFTEWALFRTPDFGKIADTLKAKVIFDGRNLYEAKEMEDLGFYYNSIGRPAVDN
jgi:UDPglucose 6-dehydrogenase